MRRDEEDLCGKKRDKGYMENALQKYQILKTQVDHALDSNQEN